MAVTRLGLGGGSRREYSLPVAKFATISGSLIIEETEVVAGGETIIITLANDTWVSAFDSIRVDIIAGLDSAQSEITGWNAEVRDKEVVTAVVRTSDTVVTITLSASADYNITASETITVTVPASALNGGVPIIATPTVGVTFTDTTRAHTVRFSSQTSLTQTGLFWQSQFWDDTFWQNQFWFGEEELEDVLFSSDSASVNFSSDSASVIMECVGEPVEVGFILLEDGFNLLLEDGGQVQLENV